jgi:SAM-dependent methyltransferase
MGAPLDWSIGRYEETAEQLLPASQAVIAAAALRPGERVVDVGCGSGNAALLAARAGVHVTGVDPAARLLEVARAGAAAEGLDATFVSGEAAAIPLDEASADVVLSVFGVIFAPDAEAAAAELARVLAPSGRILLSAWDPDGAIVRMAGVAADAVREAVGAPAGPPGFAWHDPQALAKLFAPHGLQVSAEQHSLAFTAASAGAYLDQGARTHPMAVAGLGLLERFGQADAVRARMLDVLENANEDPAAFRVTAGYVIATARPA